MKIRMSEDDAQPFYDLAWKSGARKSTNFDGDDLTAITFTPEEFEDFCQAIFEKPSAWLQIGVGPLHKGDVVARRELPTSWNGDWWRFEPLYLTPGAKDE